MLKVNPTLRPDCGTIIKKIEKTGRMMNKGPETESKTSEPNLLGTIEIPKDLRLLEGVLPMAKYNDDSSTTADKSEAKLTYPSQSYHKPQTSVEKQRDSNMSL